MINYQQNRTGKKSSKSSKNPQKGTKILQDIITLKRISSFNTCENIIFQKSSYKTRRIIYYLGAKIP